MLDEFLRSGTGRADCRRTGNGSGGIQFRKDQGCKMKQKYTITVADMELNIISDASPDEVENIVGILDRRMRDINLKSPRCTKNEAAILCALSYCSERIAMQEAFKKVEKDEQTGKSPESVAYAVIKVLKSKNPPLRKTVGFAYKCVVFLPRIISTKFVNFIVRKLYCKK